MALDISTLQPGDKVTIEAEFANCGDGRHVVLAHGHDANWASFPVPAAAITRITKVEP